MPHLPCKISCVMFSELEPLWNVRWSYDCLPESLVAQLIWSSLWPSAYLGDLCVRVSFQRRARKDTQRAAEKIPK
jgi:hypothetical protein